MANNLTFTGEVTKILAPKTGVSARGEWKSQSIQVTERKSENANHAMFSAMGDKCDLFARLRVGDFITVHYNMRSSESKTGGWYTNLNAWRIEHGTPAAATAAPTSAPIGAPVPAGLPTVNGPASTETVAEDDLPF